MSFWRMNYDYKVEIGNFENTEVAGLLLTKLSQASTEKEADSWKVCLPLTTWTLGNTSKPALSN